MKKYISALCILVLAFDLFAFTAYAKIIDREFIGSVNSLINEHWDEHYFSCISFTIGEEKMLIDGEEQPMTPALLEDGSLMLPIVDIAKAVGAETGIDEETGQITVTDGEGQTVVATSVDQEISRYRKGKARGFKLRGDGAVEGRFADGTKFIKKPRVKAELAEKSLSIDVVQEKDNVMIIKPLQLKQLVVQTKDKQPLSYTFGASEVVADKAGLHLLQYNSVKATKAALEKFSNSSNIEFAAPNQIVKTESLSWGTDRISAQLIKTKLISENKTHKDIDVAVIDTGIDAAHPFLSGRIITGYDFVDNDNIPEDVAGHGTHIAGTIVDCSTPNVKIIPVKALNNDGVGNTLTINLGIKYAADKGARVINMSFGTYNKVANNLIAQAVNYATDKGSVCVAAAGNESRDVIDICPANLVNTIAVSAIDSSDLPASFSNYGSAIDLAAPGVNINSCIPNNRYARFSGTSMAAPHVTASIAMLLLDNRAMSPSEVRDSLKYITKYAGAGTIYGMGIVDFRAYMERNSTEEYIELPFINGYPGGVFKPDADISRAEAVQILYNILAPGVKSDLGRLSEFNDINGSHWAVSAFGWAINQEYFVGSDGALTPDRPITRAELSAVLHRVAQKENLTGETAVQTANFYDINGHWAYDNIIGIARRGVIVGYNDGSFRPENNVTRAEAVVMIARLLGRAKESKSSISFSDVPQNHWAYEYIMNAVNGRSLLLSLEPAA